MPHLDPGARQFPPWPAEGESGRTSEPVEALLADVTSVAFARFTREGILIEANQGFQQMVDVPQGVTRLTDMVSAGQSGELASMLAARRDSPVRRSVRFAPGAGVPVTLLVSWVWDGEELLLVGEPPVTEAATTQPMLAKLNQRVTELARENEKKGVQLQRALGELQAARSSVEALSWRDAVTGLASRRWVEEVLQLEAARSQRYAQPFCVVMADVDHLTTITDSFGRVVGDQVLKSVADALTAAVRLTDVVSRYGSDRFLTMLTHSALEQARTVAERMRVGVSATPLTFRPEPLTASFGIAQFLPGDTVASLIGRAEQALVASKQA